MPPIYLMAEALRSVTGVVPSLKRVPVTMPDIAAHKPSTDLDNLRDGDLLGRIAQQDPAALAELFRRYGGRVLAYVRAMAGSQFPAEDAVQEIFLALWQKAGLYAPQGGEAAGWIFTVTRHKVLDIHRSLRRVREDGSLDLDLLTPDNDPLDPSLAPSLQKALSMLPADQALPIRLAYYGDLTYDETARRLGVPVGTLKTRIRSGLGSLRKMLSP